MKNKQYWQNTGEEIITPETGSAMINISDTERIISAVAGAGLAYTGFRNTRSAWGVPAALTGGYLIFRGASGYCWFNQLLGINTASKQEEGILIDKTFTINSPKNQLYAFWRSLENLPGIMSHLSEVRQLDNRRSHWSATIPGLPDLIEWEAEITEEIENELIAWQSVEHATIDNAGAVRFTETPDGGTEIHIMISYKPPMGDVGKTIAGFLNPVFRKMIKKDLKNFKSTFERDHQTQPSSDTNFGDTSPHEREPNTGVGPDNNLFHERENLNENLNSQNTIFPGNENQEENEKKEEEVPEGLTLSEVNRMKEDNMKDLNTSYGL